MPRVPKARAIFAIQTTIECYLLPEDGVAAKALFLKHLRDPHEMWIIAYSFTLTAMIEEIIANSKGGDPIHIYLDRSQSQGAAERAGLKRLVAGGVEVTIGTSPADTSYITYTKGCAGDDRRCRSVGKARSIFHRPAGFRSKRR